MGPWFTPAAYVADPNNLDIKLWVNGVLKQNSNTSRMVHGIAEQVAYLSRHVTLYPGDIIATGTLPEGIRTAAALYVGCVAGALPETEYLALIRGAGFSDVRIVERTPIPLPDEVLREHLSGPELAAFRASGVDLLSVTVLGTKPRACCSDDCCCS